jgi:hypothetical protein
MGLFKDTYAFVKDSLSIGSIFEENENKLREPTPTCVNAACSFAFQYSAKGIYLFGTDFGFYDSEKHHSTASIYHNENNEDNKNSDVQYIRDVTKKQVSNNFERPGYQGPCLTTGTYYTTKRRIDMLINHNISEREFTLYNCSDGLIIEKSIHIDKDTSIDISVDDITQQVELKRFDKLSRPTSYSTKEKISSTLYPAIKDLCQIYQNHISKMNPDIETFSASCWALSNYVNTTFQNQHGTLMYFIRGTVWHYTLSGYSIAYACKPEIQEAVITIWKERFLDFLEKLPQDLLDNLNKERGDFEKDELLMKTITE